VTRQGQILLNGVISTEEAVTAAVKAALEKNPESQAIIAADGEARHSDVVKAIDLVKSAGMNRFALQIERPEKSGP
jgi:biopolymer transport protein ExbD